MKKVNFTYNNQPITVFFGDDWDRDLIPPLGSEPAREAFLKRVCVAMADTLLTSPISYIPRIRVSPSNPEIHLAVHSDGTFVDPNYRINLASADPNSAQARAVSGAMIDNVIALPDSFRITPLIKEQLIRFEQIQETTFRQDPTKVMVGRARTAEAAKIDIPDYSPENATQLFDQPVKQFLDTVSSRVAEKQKLLDQLKTDIEKTEQAIAKLNTEAQQNADDYSVEEYKKFVDDQKDILNGVLQMQKEAMAKLEIERKRLADIPVKLDQEFTSTYDQYRAQEMLMWEAKDRVVRDLQQHAKNNWQEESKKLQKGADVDAAADRFNTAFAGVAFIERGNIQFDESLRKLPVVHLQSVASRVAKRVSSKVLSFEELASVETVTETTKTELKSRMQDATSSSKQNIEQPSENFKFAEQQIVHSAGIVAEIKNAAEEKKNILRKHKQGLELAKDPMAKFAKLQGAPSIDHRNVDYAKTSEQKTATAFKRAEQIKSQLDSKLSVLQSAKDSKTAEILLDEARALSQQLVDQNYAVFTYRAVTDIPNLRTRVEAEAKAAETDLISVQAEFASAQLEITNINQQKIAATLEEAKKGLDEARQAEEKLKSLEAQLKQQMTKGDSKEASAKTLRAIHPLREVFAKAQKSAKDAAAKAKSEILHAQTSFLLEAATKAVAEAKLALEEVKKKFPPNEYKYRSIEEVKAQTCLDKANDWLDNKMKGLEVKARDPQTASDALAEARAAKVELDANIRAIHEIAQKELVVKLPVHGPSSSTSSIGHGLHAPAGASFAPPPAVPDSASLADSDASKHDVVSKHDISIAPSTVASSPALSRPVMDARSVSSMDSVSRSGSSSPSPSPSEGKGVVQACTVIHDLIGNVDTWNKKVRYAFFGGGTEIKDKQHPKGIKVPGGIAEMLGAETSSGNWRTDAKAAKNLLVDWAFYSEERNKKDPGGLRDDSIRSIYAIVSTFCEDMMKKGGYDRITSTDVEALKKEIQTKIPHEDLPDSLRPPSSPSLGSSSPNPRAAAVRNIPPPRIRGRP